MQPQDLDETSTHAGPATPTGAVDARLRESVVTSVDALERLAPVHDALARVAQAPSSMSMGSLTTWLRAHPELAPHVVLVHRGPSLVAVAPLVRRREFGWARFDKAGVPGEPFQLLYADREAADALVRAVVGTLPRRRFRVVLDDLPDPDPTTTLLAARLPRARLRPSGAAPVLDVSARADGADRPVLSRNTRQAVAKATNRARREGRTLRSRWTRDPDEVAVLLPDLVALHIRRNADHGRPALLLDPVERAVYEGTLTAHARDGRARVLLTTLDDDLAAFAVCFTTPRRWWVWSNYADPAWLRYSPGTVSNAEVVRAALEAPEVDHLDWGQGIQRYKLSGPVHLEYRQRMETASPGVSRVLQAGRAARYLRRRLRRR